MAESAQAPVQVYEYQAEMKQLLHLIVHSLYTHREIFLRELISNASDALNLARFWQLTEKTGIDPEAPLQIRIELDPAKRLFAIEDTGIGMTKNELIRNIGTIASSGTLKFLKKLKKEQSPLDAALIGQFGVGFYSVFMVTDEVTIETRQIDPDSKGYCWKSVGEGKFTITEIAKPNRGTKISFILKEQAKEFNDPLRIKHIIKKYSNFVDFPIFIGAEKVNLVSALWQKRKEALQTEELTEFYKYLSNDFQPPLGHLTVSLEGSVNFKALLFIPATTPLALFKDADPKGLHLYSSRVMIQDDCQALLPKYLHFIEGVVDSEDLPLNVSRESTQASPVLGRIRKILTGKVLDLLDEWTKNVPLKYEKFYKNFAAFLKAGVNADQTHKGQLIDLLRFESSAVAKGQLTSFRAYVARMPAQQKEIYYGAGNQREEIERNPNLEYFQKHGIEVLFLTDPVDVFVVPAIAEYAQKPLISIDNAEIAVAAETAAEASRENIPYAFLGTFKEVLAGQIEDVLVSKRLIASPVTLVVGKKGLDRRTERMLKLLNKKYPTTLKIMEVNLTHPLIKNLWARHQKNIHDPLLKSCILQLYEGAVLLEGNLAAPTEFISRMAAIMEKATRPEA